jgi:holo-[acyl-carrier protein] synthase
MIIGMGNDLVDVRRIERALKRFGSRFEQRVFCEAERALAARRKGAGARMVAGTYAKRFAAKEACAKALGTGLKEGVSWQDIEVVNDDLGRPSLRLSGKALKRLEALTPPGRRAVMHLALTDLYPYAQAMVVLSAESA